MSRRARERGGWPGLRASAGDDDGLTLVELLVAALVTLLVLAAVPAIFQTVSATSASSTNISDGAAQARLAVESLAAQVGSAAEICLPTQVTSAGFTVRIGQITSTSGAGGALTTTGRWDQWRVTSSGRLQEETSATETEASYGFPTSNLSWNGWFTVASGLANGASSPPFTWSDGTDNTFPSSPTVGQPEALTINFLVKVTERGSSETVQVRTAVSALDALGTTTTSTTTSSSTTTTTTVPTNSCSTLSPAD